MKTRMMIGIAAVVVFMSPALCVAGPPPATMQWQAVIGTNGGGIMYTIRQIVADGSGGGVVSYSRSSAVSIQYYVVRYDKKGKELLRFSVGINLDNINVVYCDKKILVVNYVPNGGNKQMFIIDETYTLDVSAVGTDYVADMNNAGEVGGPGDKSGVLMGRLVQASGEVAVVRYSYKEPK